jgi:hypothetical protein
MNSFPQYNLNAQENDFYLILTSDDSSSMDNTPSSFQTVLDNPIELSGSWGVSLQSLYMNHSWSNLLENEYIRIYNSAIGDNFDESLPFNNYLHGTVVRPYVDILLKEVEWYKHDFTETLNNVISFAMAHISNRKETRHGYFDGKYYKNALKFTYDSYARHYEIESKYYAIHIPRKLSNLLGFTQCLFKSNEEKLKADDKTIFISTYPPNFINDNDFLYIYSNIVDEIPINNSRANILKITQVDTNFGDILSQTFLKEMYVNVSTSKLHKIAVEIRNSGGHLLQTKFGSTIMVLHFIKKSF